MSLSRQLIALVLATKQHPNSTQKHKIVNPITNKLAKHKKKLSLKQQSLVHFKNCSYECAYNWVQLWYTVQHRTVLIIFPLILQTMIIAQIIVYLREGDADQRKVLLLLQPKIISRIALPQLNYI